MKIGILTVPDFLLCSNYGSALQAYALQKVIQRMGHSPFLIRRMEYPANTLSGRWSWLYGAVGRFCPVLRGRLDKWRLCKMMPRAGMGVSFMEEYMSSTSCGYTGEERMRRMPSADAYVCGSDQVWNHTVEGKNKDLSLYFSSCDRNKCIAYAVSAAWNRLGAPWIEVASESLPSFHAVSVREDDGLELCRKAGRVDAVVAADPTLLLPAVQYERIVAPEPVVAEPYVLLYVLNMDRVEDTPLAEARRFCEIHGYRLVCLSGQGAEAAVPSEMNDKTGPLEFLNLIKNAKAVITNSFHGSLFCCIFQVPFAVCLQCGEHSAQNSRFLSTHFRLGQEYRIFHAGEMQDSVLENKPVEALERIGPWRAFSLEFLQNALNEMRN